MNPINEIKKHKTRINTATYIQIGDIEFTMRDLLDQKCPNFIAARRLEKVCKRLGIKTFSQLNNYDPFSLFNIRGVGISQIFVAMCLLANQGYNPLKWFGKFEAKNKRNHEI